MTEVSAAKDSSKKKRKTSKDKKFTVDLFAASVRDLAGKTVNGKAQEQKIAEKGVIFSEVMHPTCFNKGEYSSIRAVSPDDYTAGISTEEINAGKAALQIKNPAGNGRETIR